MKNNLVLIGFMGAGKSKIAELLVNRNHMELIDTDQVITEKIGMSIGDFFEREGEEAFRKLETKVVGEGLEQWNGCVISVGGGLPLREENRKILKELGLVIYLSVQPKTVLERLQHDTTRPLLQRDDKELQVRTLLETREPIYEEAAAKVVVADHKTPEEIVLEIEAIIRGE